MNRETINSLVIFVVIISIMNVALYYASGTMRSSAYRIAEATSELGETITKILDGYEGDLTTIPEIVAEANWYRKQCRNIFGEDFKPGNLRITTITLSSYNPVEEQCDSDPLIAADNNLIAPGVLAFPKHYRLALGLEFGQIVWAPPYGQFIVRDHMNSRKKTGRVDVVSFIPKWSVEFGIVRDIKLYWVTKSPGS